MTVENHLVLDDRYALEEIIGRGGMADVYRATDRLLLRQVAVKLVREVAEPGVRERFIDEALLVAVEPVARSATPTRRASSTAT